MPGAKQLRPEEVPVFATTIERLAGEGLSIHEIACHLEVSERTLYRYKREYNEVRAAHLSGMRRVAERRGDNRVALVAGTTRIVNHAFVEEPQGGEDVLPTLDLKGKKQPHGKLRALKQVGTQPKRGAIWKCKCDCGGYREVPAKLFMAAKGGIKACVACTDPKRRELQAKLSQYVGPVFRLKNFENEWLSYVIKFDVAQLLLFETIADGRYSERTLMEAADIVLCAKDVREELATYGRDRIERAVRRIQIKYNTRRSQRRSAGKRKQANGGNEKRWQPTSTNSKARRLPRSVSTSV